MRKIFILGLTGPSGSGKSLAAQHLKSRGFSHIDADKSARIAVEPGTPCLKALEKAFGSEIIKSDGSLDRKKLAKLAFAGGRVAELNAVTHPFIKKEIEREIDELEKAGVRFAILDAPTLIESKAAELCDSILVITASRSVRINRIIERDNISCAQAQERIDAQPDNSFYERNADYVIINDGSQSELFASVDKIADRIIKNEERHLNET